MKRSLSCVLRAFAVALLLPAASVLAAPPLLLPHTAAPPKSAKAPPFKSQGHRVQLNMPELAGRRPGDELEVTLPNGKTHVLVSDLLKDEGKGITTWVGFLKGHHEKLRAIITTGPAGSFGRITTPDGEFRLVPGEGFDWLIDMNAEQEHLPPIDLHEDFRVPSRPKMQYPQVYEPEYYPTMPGVNTVAVSKATPAQVTVDLMIVYTQGYAANLGAELQTRLAFLVASANTMYADSEVGIVLRLVHSVQVNYSDTATNNGEALDDITPVGGPVNAAFSGIEALRTQYGADMVAFLRNGSNMSGRGVAWIANAPMQPFFAPYMYSVTDGCVRGCEWVIIHEIGHNMGNMHDRSTSSWQNNGSATAPEDGSYPYSFGYYTCAGGTLSCNPNVPGGCPALQQPECSTPRSGTNNFADIMAYFHDTTTRNFKFSNPDLTCIGATGPAQPCGIAAGQPNAANLALSMNNNRTALSALRATQVSTGNPPRLANISTRMQVLTGNDVMIAGFIIGGSANKTVVVRARGPSLVPFGIANALANPTLRLVRSSDQATLATNDNWQDAANQAQVTSSGFAPSNALESAIMMTLAPGAYSAVVSGVSNGTGVGIVEVFEVDATNAPLVNISTRGQVLTGNDVMIGGFIIQGTGPQTVVVRARGPSLVPFGITNALANPSLQLVRSSDQATLATNDNWQSASNSAQILSSGFAPSETFESAIMITLQPGAYSAIVTGVGGGTGVAIMEVFAAP